LPPVFCAQQCSIVVERRFVQVKEGLEPAAESSPAERPADSRDRKRRIRWIALWSGIVLAVIIAALGIVAQLAINRAEPTLRSRVVETLATRFDSRVELAQFHVSVFRGFKVEGENLRLYPVRFHTDQPLIAIARFSFRVSWMSLFDTPMHIGVVSVEGMAINIPPKEQRGPSQPAPLPPVSTTGTSVRPAANSGLKIYVDEVLIQNTRLLIGTSKPGKLPLDFEISRVVLHEIGPGKPMKFEATLVNPKPIGDIQSTGYVGPFQQESPGDTPVWGSYYFNNANLATFKGIAGILSSTGKYQGPLNHLSVDGQTTVPDFRLNTGNHPMPLHTVFHATVDGVTGDTYLDPVEAQLAHSRFTVRGSVVKARDAAGHPIGHHITLDVVMESARIEDFLKLAVHTDPPVMNGDLRMKAQLYLPPGDIPVAQKLQLKGNFDVSQAAFGSDKIQQKINLVSKLGQGHPKDPGLRVNPPQPESNAPAEVKGDFNLAAGRMDFPDLEFSVPGATIDMAGVYTLDGSKFDFHGKAKLEAHPSQMMTGWKSLLLKMADPFFSKDGYGTVVPIEISGTKAEPHFGLDFGYKPPKVDQPAPRP
jgi:hypothetical protein